ncbi:MAG: phosphate acyltransferase PlsX [Gemmataceae bacterium]|nr:phosphate acyltransferase PlsX [Gemmataceae bacterium]MCI0737610.1 phosphate acyltransferase PlsX [Gemmataceae bacterium]
MRLALDAMGGDHAPGPIVTGAVKAAQSDAELRVVLVGDRALIEPHLAGADSVRDRLEVFHCTQVVGMDEAPVVALRKKPDNSISRCWQLLAERKVEAIVSAGNTGAMVAGGFRLRLFLKNVKRPGIAAMMPTLKGPCVLLDVGANVAPKPEHLYQYGVMGAIFAKHILQKPQPTIGLMNIGSEEAKGHDLAKDTHALFKASTLKDQFIGNIEGRDINKGVCDVVVTDGYVGNVVLKVCEGVFDFVMKMAGKELFATLQNEKHLAQLALQNLVKRYDYHEHGGAPLLGIDGIAIICHGSSGERAIESALAIAATYARAKLNALIVQELENSPHLPSGEE